MIYCNNLVVRNNRDLNKAPILEHISIHIPAGRVTCFVGPNGSGKTMLLRTIMQLNKDYEGSVLIEGCDAARMTPSQLSSNAGYIFRQSNLFPHMTVLENCLQPIVASGRGTRRQARIRAMSVMNNLGIGNLAQRYPGTISACQEQRVAIARAILLEPRVLLFDEPTTALDPDNTATLIALLRILCTKNITVVAVSNDKLFVQAIFDKLYLMQSGRIIEAFDRKPNQSINPRSNIGVFLNLK